MRAPAPQRHVAAAAGPNSNASSCTNASPTGSVVTADGTARMAPMRGTAVSAGLRASWLVPSLGMLYEGMGRVNAGGILAVKMSKKPHMPMFWFFFFPLEVQLLVL